MRPLATTLLFFILCYSTKELSCIQVGVDQGIEAPILFSPIPLAGNLSAFQDLLDLCYSDSSCAQSYGLVEAQDLGKFIQLFQIANPFQGAPNYLENALVYTIYGNSTPTEISDYIQLLEMRVAILNRSDVCIGDEYPSPQNGTIKCVPYAGRSPSNRKVQDILGTLLLVVGCVFVSVHVVKFAYSTNKTSADMAIKALADLETMSETRSSSTLLPTSTRNSFSVMNRGKPHF